jgi:hypothetical protein
MTSFSDRVLVHFNSIMVKVLSGKLRSAVIL